VAGARDGDIAKSGIQQIRMDAGVGVDEDAFGGESLCAVACDHIAVIEVAVAGGVEFNTTVVVEAGSDLIVEPQWIQLRPNPRRRLNLLLASLRTRCIRGYSFTSAG